MTRLDAILASGRTAAESLMEDACTVARVTGQSLNETTGQYVETTTQVYAGKCRVQLRNFAIASTPQAGDREIVVLQLELQLPMSAPALVVGDKATLTASVHDPLLVGRVFRVRELMHKSHATARRVVVQEEQS